MIVIYSILATTLLIIAIISFIRSNNKTVTSIIEYSEKSVLDYNVCLVENNIYQDRCLGKNMGYAATLIDYINVQFSYLFNLNENIDLYYEYYIDGIINIFDRNNRDVILYNRTIKLIENQRVNLSEQDGFSIAESLKIDYSEYNSIAKVFKEEIGINADGDLTLRLVIQSREINERIDTPLEIDSTAELIIPLTEAIININMNYQDINNSDRIYRYEDGVIDLFLLILSIANALMGIISIIIVVILINKKLKIISPYIKFLNTLEKKYGNMIINSKTLLKEENYRQILDVSNFEELVDVADRNAKHIIYTEANVLIEDRKIKRSWYAVEVDKKLYRKVYYSTDTEFK